ncbi:MAG: glycosyltransferase family 9 protein [Elusimicrobiales bacterium]|nr:glycosyltransferase family 9 protein [Elusimicrobiales bacterium]
MSLYSCISSVYSALKKYIKPAVLALLFSFKKASLKKDCNIVWIICSYGYGDVIQHIMIPREIKKIFPCSKLTIITRKKYIHFFRNDKYIDFFEEIPPGLNANWKAPVKSLFSLYRLIKKHKADLVIDFPVGLHIYELFIYRLAGVKKVYQNDSSEYSNNFVRFIGEDFSKFRMDMFIDLLEDLGAEKVDLSSEYIIPEEAEREALLKIKSVLGNSYGKRNFVLFNPEASTEKRSLPDSLVIETVKSLRLIMPEYFIIIPCFRRKMIDFDSSHATMVSFSSIEALIACAAHSLGMISVDTSTVHIADMLGLPLAAAYVKYYNDQPIPQPGGKFWHSRQKGTVDLYHDYAEEYSGSELAYALKKSIDSSIRQFSAE